jgi:hypothetical protein
MAPQHVSGAWLFCTIEESVFNDSICSRGKDKEATAEDASAVASVLGQPFEWSGVLNIES